MGDENRALVTGASGFIGSHLAGILRDRGWRIRCLLRATSSRERLPREGVEVTVGELGDRASLRDALAGVDTVFHLAGRVRGRSRGEFLAANLEGTRNLLEAAREAGGVSRFIYVSSLSAAGPSPNGLPRREEDPTRPVSLYGESKLAAEEEVRRFRDSFAVTILRPAAVYGPGDRETLQLIRMAGRGWRFQPGGAGSTFSAIHVRDVVEGIILAAGRSGGEPSTFFLADGKIHSWEETFGLLRDNLGRRACALRIPWTAGKVGIKLAAGLFPRSLAAFYLDKVREMSHKYWVCDISRARDELGFSPRYDLTVGLQETIKWYREAGWL